MKCRVVLMALVPALAVASGVASDEPAGASLTLSPDPVSADGYLQISLTVLAPPSVVGRPLLRLENLELLHGPRRREHFSWVGGTLSETTSFVWLATPGPDGEAASVEAEVRVDARLLELPARSVRIVPPAPDRSQRPRPSEPLGEMLRRLVPEPRSVRLASPRILLQATVDPVRPYRGQQTTYTLALLIERTAPQVGQIEVESIFPRRVPSFAGFWSEELPFTEPADQRPHITTVDGRAFWRQPVLRRALFPYDGATRTIEAAEVELRTSLYRITAATRELIRRETVRRQSQAVTVHARPLPEPPPEFDDAVGDYELTASLEPARVAVGETALLTVRLTGQGETSGLAAPVSLELAGVEILSPEPVIEHVIDDGLLHTRREWRYPLLPRRPGRWEIPGLEFTYFDPHRARFYTTTTAATTLHATAAPPDVADAGTTKLETVDRPTLPVVRVGLPFVTLVLLLGIVGLVWHRLGLRRRRRRLLTAVTNALDELGARRAADEIERIWAQHLELERRWSAPASISAETWAEELAARGADDRALAAARGLTDDLRYLRRAPRLASSAAMREEILQRCRTLLRHL